MKIQNLDDESLINLALEFSILLNGNQSDVIKELAERLKERNVELESAIQNS